MSRRDILSRLAGGDRLLLDGGMGSEIQRRGISVGRGATPERLGAWSATAMGDAPEVVREIHEDYLRAGADIITTNSFSTNRVRLKYVGLEDKMEEYTRLSAKIACEARDRLNPGAYVAGSVAPAPLDSWDLVREFADQAAVLTEAGVDLILVEYVGRISDCVRAVQAVSQTGLPVFLGICKVTLEGTLQFSGETGETVEQLVSALEGHKVHAILPMCSRPEMISATLPRLRQAFDGPVGAYANVGYKWAPHQTANAEWEGHVVDPDYTPECYAGFAREWFEAGAQIVGGCCATGPEHIAAVRPVIQARS